MFHNNFRLMTIWDARWQLAPEDFQYILIPFRAFYAAKIHYELDYKKYHYSNVPDRHTLPTRKNGNDYFYHGYDRKHFSQYDRVYDDVKNAINEGSFIGIDTTAQWDYYNNPFYFDIDSNLVYDCFMHHWHPFFEIHVRRAYETSLNNHNGRKPAPTVKQKIYADAPVQNAQAGKVINSKAAGRLLAAGGVYNGNVEDFRKTAELLGGDAPLGYDQVMDAKGLIIAGTSIAADLTMGRISPASEFNELSELSNIPSLKSPYKYGFTNETGTLLNAEHAVIDPKKLASYALNPDHPVGGNKAIVFESALGYNQYNVDELVPKIQSGILSSPANMGVLNDYGQRLSVDMSITGINGETAIVRTGWIYEPDALVPRLVTTFIK